MSKVYFHSDWHFNHAFVAETRGYSSAAEHDEALIQRINSVVTKRDHLWVLGDVLMGSVSAGLEKVRRVNGIKHLVLGNHDPGHPMHRKSIPHTRRFLEAFDSVSLHEQVKLPGGRKVLLSHFPYEGDHTTQDRYRQWRLRDEGDWLIHGHVHDLWFVQDRQLNVGVDRLNYPVEATTLAGLLDEMTAIEPLYLGEAE
ncbi:metallophosphoesterase [Arthrobacter phage Berrie]|uniref:Metallophosphoesterase n=1 Tax=Arthrobacter phage Berrie TaxID=2926087 RepID=A0ABZ2CL94_9CAUD